MGYLPQAMVNYLALLGWGDGTENEFFTIDELGQSYVTCRLHEKLNMYYDCYCFLLLTWINYDVSAEKFTIERVNKSGAIFDSVKLR